MDDREAQKQIQQMVNFILNEAKDKASEIEARAMEDFNIEKLKIVQSTKERIRKEYLLKMKKLETQRAIQKSTTINKNRLRKIEERNNIVLKVNEKRKNKFFSAC
jgi:V-type H+-transporting ATPase subunit E